jgi:hypothetical protein
VCVLLQGYGSGQIQLDLDRLLGQGGDAVGAKYLEIISSALMQRYLKLMAGVHVWSVVVLLASPQWFLAGGAKAE